MEEFDTILGKGESYKSPPPDFSNPLGPSNQLLHPNHSMNEFKNGFESMHTYIGIWKIRYGIQKFYITLNYKKYKKRLEEI